MTGTMKDCSNDLDALVRSSEDRSRPGRLDRLEFLLSMEDERLRPMPALASEYYEEARLSWFSGAFVSTILMTQLSFEELLRAHYRMARGPVGNLESGGRVDKSSFFSLVEAALHDGHLSMSEAKALHDLRMVRNPYVHVPDVPDPERELPHAIDFYRQYAKITLPDLVETGTEDEARAAISLLATLFARVCRRLWGLDD